MWREQIFKRQRLLRANHRYYALMGRSLGQQRQLLAGILTNANAGLAKRIYETLETQIFAFAGN
jgi:hypothetical protein